MSFCIIIPGVMLDPLTVFIAKKLNQKYMFPVKIPVPLVYSNDSIDFSVNVTQTACQHVDSV